MSFRRSNSLAVLALAAACVVPCVSPPAVRAGDKIEFSAPSVVMEVPRAPRDDKISAKSIYDGSMQAAPEIPGPQMPYYPEIVVYSTPNKKAAKSRDSAFTDEDVKRGDLDDRSLAFNGATNLWDSDRFWNQDIGSAFYERRGDNPANQDNLHARLDGFNTSRAIEYQKDEQFNNYSSDLTRNPALSHGIFHYGSSGIWGMRDGQYQSLYDSAQAADQEPVQARLSVPKPSLSDDLLRESRLPPGMAQYNLQLDALHGKTPDETLSTRRAYQTLEAKRMNWNPDPYSQLQAPAPPPGQVQPRPAILPFPKRPGSVFQ